MRSAAPAPTRPAWFTCSRAGPPQNHFTANKTVGYLSIAGRNLKRDLLVGMEIDLTFELSESRDLKVDAFVNPSGPEFSQIFTPTRRGVPVAHLAEEVDMLDAPGAGAVRSHQEGEL